MESKVWANRSYLKYFKLIYSLIDDTIQDIFDLIDSEAEEIINWEEFLKYFSVNGYKQ